MSTGGQGLSDSNINTDATLDDYEKIGYIPITLNVLIREQIIYC